VRVAMLSGEYPPLVIGGTSAEMTLKTGKGPRLPYAFPITVGALAVLWLK